MACFALPPSGNAMPPSFLLRAGDAGFASDFADHIGRREEALLFTDSGTSALYVAFRAVAALRRHGRIAVPAWCCPSVPQAAIQAGLRPVLVDLDPETLGYAAASLDAARAHPEGLAAVLLVHFFGQAAVRPDGEWGSVLFIRDCAQDFEYNPVPGDDAPCAYSFGRGKALNAGHGGALCLPAEGPAGEGAFAAACRSVHAEMPESAAHPMAKALAINVLSHPRLFWAVSAMPGLHIGATIWEAPLAFARLSPAFPRLGSACFEAYLQRRHGYRDLVARYRALAEACDPAQALHPQAPGADAAGPLPTRFPVLFGDAGLRDRFIARVKAEFGGVTRMYPEPLPDLPGAPRDLEGADADPGDPRAFPGARRLARGIVTLPVAAALMGREEAFLSFLESVLEAEGVLTAAPAQGGQSGDWTPVPARVPRPALFPGA